MKTCLIFCAGAFSGLGRMPREDTVVIAADGGLAHAQALGITPHVILGDFDSLGYTPAGAEVHPVEKDDTDSMLAIKRGLQMGCREFYLYGAMDGQRVDHTVANFQALKYLADRGCRGYLMGCHQIATVLSAGECVFPGNFEGYLSIFCIGADALDVTVRGAQYELEGATLSSAFPLGVSNRFAGKQVTVSVREGSLLLLWDSANGPI